MPLTDEERRALWDLDQRLTASSPELARLLAWEHRVTSPPFPPPRPPLPVPSVAAASFFAQPKTPRSTRSGLRQMVAAVLVVMVLGLGVGTIAVTEGVRWAVGATVLCVEVAGIIALLRLSGRSGRPGRHPTG